MSDPVRSVLVQLAMLSLFIAGAANCGSGANQSSGGAPVEYFPTTIGATWSYAVTPASGSGSTEQVENTAGSPSSLSKTFTENNVSSHTDSFELDSSGIFITGSTYPTGQVTYAPPLLLLPSNTTPGFSTSTTSTEQRSTGTTDTVTVAGTVDGIETVTVPAGTFSALKVTRLMTRLITTPVGTSQNVKWYAPGVGCVRTVGTDPQGAATTWDLTSYNIP